MRHLLILVTALLLASCGTNKYLASSTKPNDIKNVDYFTPFSYIQYIEKGNKTSLSDSLSNISQHKIDSLLSSKKNTLQLSEKIILDNDTIKQKIEHEITYLVNLIIQRKKLNDIPLTSTIDSILKSNNQRFALATIATGFGRRKGNYGGQVAKGVAIGILTLGMAIPTPTKSNLTLYALIFDSQKNEIAYYKSLPIEKEPTDENVIEKQLIRLFEGYLYEKK